MQEHTDLKDIIINASVVQLLYDQNIAEQRFYKSNIESSIGNVVKYKGDYSGTFTYTTFNIVTYNYKAYMCVSASPIVGVVPTDTNSWIQMSIVGPSGSGMSFFTSYDNTYTYTISNCLPYANKLYVSIVNNNLNHQPDISPNYWSPIITVPYQTIISNTQPTGQDSNGYWHQTNSTDNSYKVMQSNGDGTYTQKYPVSNASLIKTSDGNNVQNFIDSKGQPNGIATLGDDGKVPAEQLSIPAPNYAGTLIVHVSSSDGGSVAGTRVRIRNEQLGANYVQPLDALANTTFSLLDNHTYYLVLLDYPSQYYGAAASVSIAGGETQTLNLTLKTEPDIVGWRENVATGEIQYTDGAVNFQPMTVTDGVFDPGSWGESWLCDMRPCLLKAGVVQYYLQKTGTLTYDYSKQANGTPSDIVSGDDGDVMIEFPLTYYKTYTETDINNVSWLYWKFSKIPQDDTWCCNAWLSADGVPQEVFYMAAYDGFVYNNALRSLSGQTPTVSQTIGTFRTAANANGVGYEQQEWAKRAYVQSLLPMLFKGLDSQTLVGKGVSSAGAKIDTGTMNDKPLFWGDQTGTIGVKFAGIENFWGNIYKFADGLINVSNAYKYKIYGPYNDTGSGYTSAGTIGGTNGQYIDTMQVANGYGMLPKTTVAAAADSKFHDYLWKSSSNTCICYTGGSWNNGASVGAFDLYLNDSADFSSSYIGASLSYTPV